MVLLVRDLINHHFYPYHLTLELGNNNATNDTAMSGLEYPMEAVANFSKNQLKPKKHSSINSGEIQQRANLARMLQPTVRALQSATDKAIYQEKKLAIGSSIEPVLPSGQKAVELLSRIEPSKSNNQKPTKRQRKVKAKQTAPTEPKTKPNPPKKKKKKTLNANTQVNVSEGSVNKIKKTKIKGSRKEQRMAYLLESRQDVDARKIKDAADAAKASADVEMNTVDQGPNPRDWQTVYEQEYQARTAKLRERQIRDEQALMSALNGLSLVGGNDPAGDYDLIL